MTRKSNKTTRPAKRLRVPTRTPKPPNKKPPNRKKLPNNKKLPNRKNLPNKKTGRPRDIEIEDLPERYRKAKSFLEHHWGVFSLDLAKVREPDDVKELFKRIQGVEWMAPFREDAHARCLISEKTLTATSKQIRATRRKMRQAEKEENRLWFEYNNTHPGAREGIDALNQAISSFQNALGLFPFFAVITILASHLRVEHLTQLSSRLEKAAREATAQKNNLKERLRANEADFARREIVRFVNENDRADRTLINFARVIAGLPEWSWLHSIRECKKLHLGHSTPEYSYQIFLRVKAIVRRMKPPKVDNIEKRLREELLSPDCDPMLKGYADMHWNDLCDAIYSCREVAKRELPDKIMGNFVLNLQRPKNLVDQGLAKRNRLVSTPS